MITNLFNGIITIFGRESPVRKICFPIISGIESESVNWMGSTGKKKIVIKKSEDTGKDGGGSEYPDEELLKEFGIIEEGADDIEGAAEVSEKDAVGKGGRKSGIEINFRIEDLPKVGKATAKKLREAGYISVNQIAGTPARKLQEDAGLGEATAQYIVNAAREALQIGFITAKDVWERRKSLSKITTGSKALDDILGGGIEPGCMTEFFGEFRTGKTQIMHQLCVNVQLPKELGGLGGKALYMDTEGTFRPERIIQMAEALNLDHNEVLRNIIYVRIYSSDHQILVGSILGQKIIENNVKLLVVDSLISHFRAEYVGRGTLAERQQKLNNHIHDLLRLAEMAPELAVVITNQVQSKPDVFFGDPTAAAGGNIIAHAATVRVYLRKSRGDKRIAKVIDAPNLPEAEAVFVINEDGIRDE